MDIIDKFCSYFIENNEDKFLQLFTENAVYIDCLYGKFSGKNKILEFYKRCHKEAHNYKFIPKNKIFTNNLASFEWDFSFISNMPLSKGEKIEISGASFITFNNHKISFYRDYCDSVLFLLQGNIPEDKIIKFYKKKYSL